MVNVYRINLIVPQKLSLANILLELSYFLISCQARSFEDAMFCYKI